MGQGASVIDHLKTYFSELLPDHGIGIAYRSRDKEQHHPSTHHPRPPVSSCVRWSLSTELPLLSLIRRSGRFSLRSRAAGQPGDVGRLQKIRFYMIANTNCSDVRAN